MNIKPLDFLLAKNATDYFIKVFDLEMSDEHYNYHIYNLAVTMSTKTGMSEKFHKAMAERDNFLETIESFSSHYWKMIQQINNG